MPFSVASFAAWSAATNRSSYRSGRTSNEHPSTSTTLLLLRISINPRQLGPNVSGHVIDQRDLDGRSVGIIAVVSPERSVEPNPERRINRDSFALKEHFIKSEGQAVDALRERQGRAGLGSIDRQVIDGRILEHALQTSGRSCDALVDGPAHTAIAKHEGISIELVIVTHGELANIGSWRTTKGDRSLKVAEQIG